MPAPKPLEHRYGMLSVVRREGNRAFCICDCGKDSNPLVQNLRRGLSRSCGCMAKKVLNKPADWDTESNTYHAWENMHARTKRHADYIKKKIHVCRRWSSFQNFLEDMGECPEKMTLDRIDNALGYSPDNCRWASRMTQANNRDLNVFVTIKGQTKTLAEWAKELCVSYMSLYHRYRRGELEDK